MGPNKIADTVRSATEPLSYWQEKLDRLPTLDLPHDHLRAPVSAPSQRQVSRGQVQTMRLPERLVDALQTLGGEERASLFVTMLTAFQVVLFRYSGQEDIVLGTTIRDERGEEAGGGGASFANTLLLRSDLSGTPTFRELLGRVREVWSAAWAHRGVPFEQVVTALQPEQDASRVPLCQVLFEMEDAGAGLSLSEASAPPFDLIVRVRGESDGYRVEFAYDEQLFEAATIRRMIGHTVVLMQGAADTPEQRVSELPLLTEEERRHLIEELNDTVAPYPEACLHELFEEQVVKQPDAPAVLFADQTLTYAELNSRANRLSHALRKLGIGPESVVGICVEKSPEMVVGLLGILKAGAAYCPLDPAYPQERLAFMLQDAQVPVLLTQAHLRDVLPAAEETLVICLDSEWAQISVENDTNPERLATPDNPSYVIYTSGTTGLPKGIVVLHRGVVNNVHDLNTRYAVGSSDKVIAISSLSFDMCVYEVFGMLMAGACTVIPTREEAKNQVAWAELAVRHGVTIWNSAPQLLEFLVGHLEKNPSAPRPPIRLVLLGGDWVPVKLPDRLKSLCPGSRVIVMGGATEASIHSIIFEVEETDPTWTSIPYGVPMTNQTAYLLDANLQLVPIGVAGELHLGGIGLTREYLRRPELTAAKFIENPIRDGRSARLYKTGDLAKYRPDGTIELLGRIDLQVKIRGLRIEVGEIEVALKQHPAVQDAVVVARADNGEEKRLVAYVVPRQPDELPSGSSLRAFLQDHLPPFMVPTLFVRLAKLPLSPNGKVDRRSLPVPAPEDILSAALYVAPESELETWLAAAFAEVLGVEKVGVEDDFFVLGGHSLLATQVLSRLREAKGLELPIRSLFESPTVRSLARQAVLQGKADLPSSELPIRRVTPREQLPLSFAQRRLWFLDRLQPNNAAYNVPFLLELSGALDVALLESGLNELVRRHEVLRTTFAEVEGQPVQVILPSATIRVTHLDLEKIPHLPGEERRDIAMRVLTEESAQVLDLSKGPLLRAHLVQVSETEHLLLLNIHHIVYDGWSMRVFVREFASIYTALQKGAASPSPGSPDLPILPELPIQYGDFTVWQQEWLQSGVLEAQLAYWRQKLSGELPILQLPTDRPRPAVPSGRGARQRFALAPHLTEALKSLSREKGVTLYMTLLAAFQTLLYRYTGQQDVIVGSPIAGRTRSELEPLIGFFVNTLVMRTDLAGSPTFAELLHRVRETALDAYAHQDVPFETLVMDIQPERDKSVSPLFQVMFVLQNNEDTAWELPDLHIRTRELHPGTAMFDMTLELAERDGALVGEWEYANDLFDGETITRMIGHYSTLLEGVVANSEQPLWALPLLTEAERHKQLIEWNETANEALKQELFLPRFEALAAQTPEQTALLFGKRSLTYRELNERANQLAHALRQRGIGQGKRVGLYMDRSIELIVSIFAVFKSGAAYVPLDPAYPRDRVEFIMEDAEVSFVLTEQHLQNKVPGTERDLLCVDVEWETIRQHSIDNPDFGVTAETTAYLIYTSGSTGSPKGVVITHRGLANFAVAMSTAAGISPHKRLVQMASINFDMSVCEYATALLSGATLVLITPEAALLGQHFIDWVREQHITHLMIAPSTLASLPYAELPALEALLVGGEANTAELVARWAPGRRYYNIYGPTETTIVVTIGELRTDDAKITLGRPFPNVKLYLLDEHLQPVPVGVVGELYISAVGLARGYLNRPELTAASFVPNPFGTEPSDRLYKTGDLGRYLPDGRIEYVGRSDHQVKIRGFRIELGEIEAGLLHHPAVHESLVMAREDRPGDKRLVAYVTAGQSGESNTLTPAELKRHLQQKLPSYMVPTVYVVLDAFPLTPNGKVDRKALPVPDARHRVSEYEHVEPRTETEELVAAIFSVTLDAYEIGVHDSFFDLGGHSLLATQVLYQIRDVFGIHLSIGDLFDGPTVAEMAARVDQVLQGK